MEGAHRSSSSSPTAGSVNVEKAENSFHELSRQLTQGTIVDVAESARVRTSIDKRTTKDLEKGEADLEEPFDLREYLSSSNDANERGGIKHKHVGVLWEDFHVDVLGGSGFKVGVRASRDCRLLKHPIGEIAICAHLRRSVGLPGYTSSRLKIHLCLDESWQFWITPFYKLRGVISGLLPSRVKNDVTRTILHKCENFMRLNSEVAPSNFGKGVPAFWSPDKCASYLELPGLVARPF
jgi:ATP-binding cassette, subfamily G (WHITE), member 2, PDR